MKMGKEMESNKINRMINELSQDMFVPYEQLPPYDLFLSQVTDFLNDNFKNEHYTNNIIQNYIKSEVISKPEAGKKRGYTKLHLVQLVILSYMRPVLTMDQIKKVFSLAFNDINDRSDDIINWEQAYECFCEIQKEAFDSFAYSELFNESNINSIIGKLNLKKEDEHRITLFIMVIILISQSSVIKNLVKRIIDASDNSGNE